MALKTSAPKEFYGVSVLILLLVIGLILGTVLASQSCKNGTSKFGNLIDTLKTAAQGTVAATQTLGEAIGITGSTSNETTTEEFTAEEKSKFPWWGYLLIIGGVTTFVGIVTGAIPLHKLFLG